MARLGILLPATALVAAPLLAPHQATLSAQTSHAGHGAPPPADAPRPAVERLGEIRFATSARPTARAAFERGVLYLHNFHYPQAVAAFARARALDTADVMSAAFLALAHTHPVWNEQDTAAARAALRQLAPTREARAALARTARERAWLDAVETLYDGDAPKAVRDTAYSRAMARLHANDPADPEAATFYALSLLGLNQGVREPRAYAMAEALSDSVRRRHPRHPGALHYLIHAVDEPGSAARGLDAAAAYGALAPDASHAQHMTSHIFIALGRWDDVVRANLAAHRAQPAALHSFGHGTHWLAYGLVQQGKVGAARAWVDSMLTYHRMVTSGQRRAVRGTRDADAYAVRMAASWVLDTDGWDTPLASARFDTARFDVPATRTLAEFLTGFAAARRAGRPVDLTAGSRAADRALADSMLARIAERNARAGTDGAARVTTRGEMEVMEQMLRAELLVAAGRADSAVVLLQHAAARLEALPFEFGPPATGKPPRERAAEILLIRGRLPEALAQLDSAERMYPGRARARHLRARTLVRMGRLDEASRVYRELAALWRGADATLPAREEVRWGSTVLPSIGADASVRVDTVGYANGALALRGRSTGPPRQAGTPRLSCCTAAAGATAWTTPTFSAGCSPGTATSPSSRAGAGSGCRPGRARQCWTSCGARGSRSATRRTRAARPSCSRRRSSTTCARRSPRSAPGPTWMRRASP